MARASFKKPTKAEMHLRRERTEVTRRLELFMADASGAAVIAELEETVGKLKSEITSLEKLRVKNSNLIKKNQRLLERTGELKKENASLRWDVKVAHSYGYELERKLKKTEKKRHEWAELARRLGNTLCLVRAENRSLKAKLNRNSTNSALPPSACPNTKMVHNSRMPTTRKRGGQVGHVGHRRHRQVPDETIRLDGPAACTACGGPLGFTGEYKTRQMTDLHITVYTTEYEAGIYDCTACGRQVHAPFPNGVVNEANYGNNVRAVSSYLVNACNVSIDNTTGFLFEATNHRLALSKGSVHNFLASFEKKAEGEIDAISSHIKGQPVCGSDATYAKAGGKRTYVYTYNCPDAVIYEASDTKGIAPLLTSPIKDYQGILVHDHDSAYYNINSGHAECNVHILRYLKGVAENEGTKMWPAAMYALLLKAKDWAKKASELKQGSLSASQIEEIESRYDEICEMAESEYADELTLPKKYQPDGIALYRRLAAYKPNHLAFIYDLAIPFDNNASERLLRGVKKKLKQTGGFRSIEQGMDPYCCFISITQTASLRGMEALGTIRSIYEGEESLFKYSSKSEPSSNP